MFVRTHTNKLVNLNKMTSCEIDTICFNSSALVAKFGHSTINLYSGESDDVTSAMNTLVEGIARGATLISYYKDDCDDSMCSN